MQPTPNDNAPAVGSNQGIENQNQAKPTLAPAPQGIKPTDALRLLHDPGELVELRAIHYETKKLAEPQWFSDIGKLSRAAEGLNRRGFNCYHTINPINPAWSPDPTNGVHRTTDDAIQKIRWLPYDIDPVRNHPQKGKVMANGAEVAAAWAVAEKVIEYWREYGIDPAIMQTGNGVLLLVPCDLDTADAPIVASILKQHHELFSTPNASIDVSVSNPARILAVPGTIKRKGEASEDRPYRSVVLVHGGSREGELSAEELRGHLRTAPKPEHPTAVNSGVTPEWVEEFLEHSEIEFQSRRPYRAGHKWILRTVHGQDYCPNQTAHTSENNSTVQAVFLGPDGIPGFECLHSRCSDVRWKNFREFHEKRNESEGRGRFRSEWSDRPDEIVIAPAALNESVGKAESILSSTPELKYFRRGTDLVKPVQFNKADVVGLNRAQESIVIQPVTTYTIIRDVNLRGKCVDLRGHATSFTANFAEHVLDRVRTGEGSYRPLDTVTSSPVFLSDGTVLDRAGYRAGVLFVGVLGVDYPAIPQYISQDLARAELRKFDAIFRDFPFVKQSGEEWWQTPSYATILGAILSLVARPAIPTVPLFSTNANTPGTGKTKLVEAATVAALGHKPTVVSFHGEDEFAKTLVPLLREGDRATLIDNVSIPLTGDMICSVLTSEKHNARILGQSEQVKLLNRTVFFATGNNLAVQGDLTRRALQAMLDADCEHPELRKFSFDPVIRAAQMHPELAVAAVTALRGYQLAGRPWKLKREARLGGFEVWDELVSGCLAWLGFADPVFTQEHVRESDPEREDNLQLLAAWWKTYPEAVTVGVIGDDPNKEVYALLARDGWNAKAVGLRLRKLAGRVIDGYKLRSKTSGGYKRWYVTYNGAANKDAAAPPALLTLEPSTIRVNL